MIYIKFLNHQLLILVLFFPKDNEILSRGYVIINKTPNDTSADLSHGILTGGDVFFLCLVCFICWRF